MKYIDETATQTTRILIVDGDSELRQSLANQLRLHRQYDVVESLSCSDALQLIKDRSFDLVLLDIHLPDFDGFEMCRCIRKNGHSMPIIMVSSTRNHADEILALDCGADDFITKPFHLPVLLARIAAQLRRHERGGSGAFALGPYTFRPSDRILVDDVTGNTITLTTTEAAMLKFLSRREGNTASREVLLDQVWGYNPDVETHTIETHIFRLRRKIERDPRHPELLVADNGGYRMVV